MVKHYVFEAQTSGMTVEMDTNAPPSKMEIPISKKSPALQRILAKKKHRRV